MANESRIKLSPNDGRTIALAGDLNRFLITGADTGGAFAQWESIIFPGGGPNPHVHSHETESFFIVEGEVELQIGDVITIAGPGVFANMPAGLPHGFKNHSSKVARILITVAPAGLEGLFFDAGIEVEPGRETPLPVGPDEKARVHEAAPKYGIEFIKPASVMRAAE